MPELGVRIDQDIIHPCTSQSLLVEVEDCLKAAMAQQLMFATNFSGVKDREKLVQM